MAGAGSDTPRPFLAIFGGSEGTTFFCDVVGKTEAVYCPAMEPLERHRPYMRGVTDRSKLLWLSELYSLPANPSEAESWLEKLRRTIPNVPLLEDLDVIRRAKVAGIKMRPSALAGDGSLARCRVPRRILGIKTEPLDPYRELFRLLKAHEVVPLFFRRENLVKQAISSYRMTCEKKSQFIRRDSSPSTIDPAVLLAAVEEYERYLALRLELIELATAVGLEAIEIRYEDILEDPLGVFRTFFEAAQIPCPREVDSLMVNTRFKKATRDDLTKVIVNYDEVSAYLQGTPYAGYLSP